MSGKWFSVVSNGTILLTCRSLYTIGEYTAAHNSFQPIHYRKSSTALSKALIQDHITMQINYPILINSDRAVPYK
ncbi:MAG: hypothetical protein ACHP6H_07285, partial [Legionellales bacterium]